MKLSLGLLARSAEAKQQIHGASWLALSVGHMVLLVWQHCQGMLTSAAAYAPASALAMTRLFVLIPSVLTPGIVTLRSHFARRDGSLI